ncbi:MAG: hypothetical protein M4579_006172 [Chaenotheca gracillima]|nr:MAG: hypothetical protein M4579_006172 [Chaenotheca gracillima]
MHKFFKSPFFDFETVRLLGEAVYGGADAAEFLEAVGEIRDNDPVSWNHAWAKQAEKAEALADKASKDGDLIAARRAYLRASNYTRASGYLFINRPVQDPRALPIAEKVIQLFRKAVKLLDGDVHFLEIPYEGHHLPGYLYLPPSFRRLPGKVPVVLNCGGADSIQEELFYLNPAAGPDQGYAVLTFDGPGQGIMLKKHGLTMRPDWEVVTSQIVDYLTDYATWHPELELDLDRLSVSGASMGAYYALRAASDPRFKACVAIDPFFDMWDFGTAHISTTFIGLWTGGWLGDGTVNSIIGLMSKLAFQLKWEVGIAGAFFGIDDPSSILREMKKYTLRLKEGGSFLDRVKCPVLVSGAGESLYLNKDVHAMNVYRALDHLKEGKRELWMPETPGEGSLQAKMGALPLCNQHTFRFLDKHLEVGRESLFSKLDRDQAAAVPK